MLSMSRRGFVTAASVLTVTGGALAKTSKTNQPDFAAIEHECGGKLGIFALDTENGKTLGWRADNRFPFYSSTKGPLAAYVLWKADRGELRMDQLVHYTEGDLLPYAPVTRPAVAKGALTYSELCRAAVALSDNTAANLLWRETGGPKALTAWMRREGDHAYDLSSVEPELNLSRYGDAHNTSTPRAMAESYRRFVLGDVLKPASRDILIGWLVSNKTGDKRLRAGLPPSWRVGDKTGTYNEKWFSTADIAVAWPPNRRPLVISALVTDTPDTGSAERAMAEAARAIASWVG